MTWQKVDGAEGYSIYFEEQVSGKTGAVDCGAETAFQLPMPPGAKFQFCVQAHRWGGVSPCSALVVPGS